MTETTDETSADPVTVLLVDDNRDWLALVVQRLREEAPDFDVREANSPEGALDRLTDDVERVVSDYYMPGRTGIELLSEVREHRPDIPFLLFTGASNEGLASSALSAGANDYIVKTSSETAPRRSPHASERPSTSTGPSARLPRARRATGRSSRTSATPSSSPATAASSSSTRRRRRSPATTARSYRTVESDIGASVLAGLTDRQRESLEVAYRTGYFERPKRRSAAEVAEAIGVSRSTFTQHLRAAHRKVFAELFDGERGGR
ncbi:receiver box HTH-10 family transcription regulator (plasmid) [Haloferax volcanii DS2]|uniref:Bacterio-opsin activator-like protein n=2 Tax=Haloferax volcanii (strain ATCC 29605 / DSM 3757 / JCM 8879 / NBRC 14742 / NCIMB 2012 / VKM B-1768 / DS2) TaxID=309800 RepID=A0A384K9V2_HALVD|nr:receiver box HTH-10 family transcription regulator [Haloferax volcanii DS2]ELY36937.1 bacterio-opsin activator-like protein [Haloferax volcanii DS2]